MLVVLLVILIVLLVILVVLLVILVVLCVLVLLCVLVGLLVILFVLVVAGGVVLGCAQWRSCCVLLLYLRLLRKHIVHKTTERSDLCHH